MDQTEKEILAWTQLENAVKLLDGVIIRQTTLDSAGRTSKRVLIEYDIEDRVS
tara:strand:- start:52 stop:210 length:159 start_codon:yes stop_codon:yes gene_type:complete